MKAVIGFIVLLFVFPFSAVAKERSLAISAGMPTLQMCIGDVYRLENPGVSATIVSGAEFLTIKNGGDSLLVSSKSWLTIWEKHTVRTQMLVMGDTNALVTMRIHRCKSFLKELEQLKEANINVEEFKTTVAQELTN